MKAGGAVPLESNRSPRTSSQCEVGVNEWSPKPWVVSAEPPAWLRERASAEAWPAGTVSHWRRRLRDLNVESVHATYTEGQLSSIGLDGVFQEIDKQHPAPVEHALRECLASVEQATRPPLES